MSSTTSSDYIATTPDLVPEPQTWDEYFHLVTAPATIRAGEEFEIVLGTAYYVDLDIEDEDEEVAILAMPAEKKIASAFQEIMAKPNKGISTFTSTFDPKFDYDGLTELNFHQLVECERGHMMIRELTVRIKVKTEQ